MSNLNLYSPLVSLKIFTVSEDSSNVADFLDLRSWSKKPQAPYLQNIEIKSTLGAEQNGMNFTISGPFEMMRGLIEKNFKYFTGFNGVSAQIGYARSQRTKTYHAQLNPPEVNLSESNIELSFQATPTVDYLSVMRETPFIKKGKTSILEILKDISNYNKFKLKVITPKGKKEDLTSSNAPEEIKENGISLKDFMVYTGHYEVMKDLIDLAGLDFYTENDEFIIVDHRTTAQVTKGFAFKFRDDFDLKNNVLPIFDFNHQAKQVTTRSKEVVKNSYVDLDKKEVKNEKSTVKDVESKRPGSGKTASDEQEEDAKVKLDGRKSAVTRAKMPEGVKNAGEHKTVDSEDQLKKQKRERRKIVAQQAEGVTANITTIGHPQLKPGMKVRILGVTKLFNGEYQIHGVTHTGDDSGYQTELKVMSTGRKIHRDSIAIWRAQKQLEKTEVEESSEESESKSPESTAE